MFTTIVLAALGALVVAHSTVIGFFIRAVARANREMKNSPLTSHYRSTFVGDYLPLILTGIVLDSVIVTEMILIATGAW